MAHRIEEGGAFARICARINQQRRGRDAAGLPAAFEPFTNAHQRIAFLIIFCTITVRVYHLRVDNSTSGKKFARADRRRGE